MTTLSRIPAILLSLVWGTFVPSTVHAQTLIDVGTGTVTNTAFTAPSPYSNSQNGSRHQLLFLASELQAAGMTAGNISALGFNVSQPSGTTLVGFSGSIGTTAANALTATAWETGLWPAWAAADFTDAAGWTEHIFNTPYYWDGVSNLVIETCFTNPDISQNAVVFQTATTFTSCVSRNSPNPTICTALGGTHVEWQQRPNVRFTWTEAEIAPAAAFTANTYSCDPTVSFTDQSLHLPTSWDWDFGDASSDVGPNPDHTYAGDGIYVVTLVATNAFGSNSASLEITINSGGLLPAASCSPTATDVLSGIGIGTMSYGDVTYSSPDAATEGYQDRSCVNDTVREGDPFTLTIEAASSAPHQIAAWIDWNNDAAFDASEQVLSAANAASATATFAVPGTAVLDVPLRIRVMADDAAAGVLAPCTAPLYGQAEDYALVVVANTDPPVASFSISETVSCGGVVSFADLSTNLPTGWVWDFGDNSPTDDSQSPTHTYTTYGTFSVTLTVSNDFGTDDTTQVDPLTVVDPNYCDTLSIPDGTAAGFISTECGGVLVDDGGATADYTPGTSAAFTIAPTGAATVALTFSMFAFDIGGGPNPIPDSLYVFDGPNINSPVIGWYTGTVLPNGGVITSTGPAITLQQRCTNGFQSVDQGFLLNWLCTPSTVPPVAAFTANPAYSCNGVVQFTDESTNLPTEWSWDFGDVTSDTQQDPSHTYTADGIYTVILTATNAYGSDTYEMQVTVALNSLPPVTACDAPSSGTVTGFGILDVNIEGTAHPSGDAVAEGYADNTCQQITVTQGTLLDLAVTTGSNAPHAVRAWLDMDNSGTFTANELLLTGTGPAVSSSTLIGSGVVLNLPLRLRAIAAYDLVTPDPSACGTIQFGQAEDYSIVVVPNVLPPVAAFSVDPTFSCSGTVQFTDLSLNLPTAWTWDFGDTNGSNDQSPSHTYTASNTYTVTLIAINANGQDDTVAVNMVTVDLSAQVVAAACAPQTSAYCCGYGILGFDLAGISSTSVDASEGYQDRSCGNLASVTEGSVYAWSVTNAAATPHDTRIWIDMNNDGSFTTTELVATALDQVSPAGNLTIPVGVVFDTPLRLRVISDVIGQTGGPCDAPLFGQAEDFSVTVAQNAVAPIASFTAAPWVTCDGVVQFTDLSTNLPNEWLWNFGDGSTSDEQSPQHTYQNTGTFDVTFTASNAFGSDVFTGTISYVPGWQCDTLQLDGNQDLSSTACLGVLSDDGGPEGPYTGGNSGAFTIAPDGAVFVTITFSQFAWGNNPNRWLAIYDGPDAGSPQIGTYSGNGLGQLLNNGIITSTGPSITLVQEQQGGGGPPPNSVGFLLTWNCSLTGIEEATSDPIGSIRPQPADDRFAVDLLASTDAMRELVLRDALGRVLERRVVAGSAVTVWYEVSHFAAGPYVLQVHGDHTAWSRALIIR